MDILELDNKEKFKNSKGDYLDIEVRGIRNRKKCYFKAIDIAKEFEMPNLCQNIMDKNKGYLINKHYIFLPNIQEIGNKVKKSSKKLYLTYHGFVRLLYVSKNKNAEHFQDWANDILFTAQLGTANAKAALASKLIGASTNSVKEFSKTLTKPISCIYLCKIGYVRDLRKSMNISAEYDDDDIVLKFGRTIDINERVGDHLKEYGSIKGSSFELIYCCYIDPIHASKAEARVHRYFKALDKKFKYKDKKELIVASKEFMKTEIKEEYEDLNYRYGGEVKDVNYHVQKLTTDKEMLKKDCKSKVVNIQHKLDILNKDYELLKKDFEIYKLKHSDETSDED